MGEEFRKGYIDPTAEIVVAHDKVFRDLAVTISRVNDTVVDSTQLIALKTLKCTKISSVAVFEPSDRYCISELSELSRNCPSSGFLVPMSA